MVKAKKNIKRKRSVSRKKNSQWLDFLKSERLHFLLGVIIAFAGIFIFLSMVSFPFTGAADQSKVLNRSFVELVNDKNLQVNNWTGVGGAFIAEGLINGGFGIFSVLIPFFIVYVGLRLMKVSNFSFFKALFFMAFSSSGSFAR
jgi:S-DNA-T family DNA segregation ATPase FtsK/SpoIIIE